MDLAERFRQGNGYAQKARQIEWSVLVPLKNPIQTLTTRVLKYEDRPPLMTSERERLSCPFRIDFACERVFVRKPPKTLRRRVFCGWRHYQDGRSIAVLLPAVKGEIRTFPDGHEQVPSRFCSGRHPHSHGYSP